MISVLIALAASAHTPDPRCSSTKTDDLINCVADRYANADILMNAQWKKLQRTNELVRAQRAWTKFRDAECDAANPAAPQGREYQIYRLGCLADLTEQRTKQLHDYFEWR